MRLLIKETVGTESTLSSLDQFIDEISLDGLRIMRPLDVPVIDHVPMIEQ